MIARYATDAQVDAARKALADHWEALLSTYHLESGEEKLDRMVNIWHQYQCMVTFNMSRSASYFESGTGRGMGFRDSCQDLLALYTSFRPAHGSAFWISPPPSLRMAAPTTSISP